MNTTEAILEQAADLLRGIAPVSALDDSRLVHAMELTEEVGRLIDTLRVFTAAEIADRSRHELGSDGLSSRLGQRRPHHLIEQRTRVSGAEAMRRIRLGALVRTRTALDGSPLTPLYPQVAAALGSGSVGTDAAMQIIHHLEQAAERCSADDLAKAEKTLVEGAAVDSADLVGMSARLWRDFLDADGAAPRDEELRRSAEIRLGRERDGMTPITGLADPINAAKLKAMFNSYRAPRGVVKITDANGNSVSCPDGDPTAVDPGEVPVDMRTIGQRNFDILIGVITAGLSADTAVPRSKATVLATIRLEDYETGRGVGWLEGVDEPISARSVQELGCDSDVRLVVFGDNGEVLRLGHKIRLFNYAQRLALTARDGGCIWTNCSAPSAWCDAHHVIPHGGGNFGPTNIENGVLLCPAHHHALHHSDMTIVMEHGVPRIVPPQRLGPSTHRWAVGRSRVSRVMRR